MSDMQVVSLSFFRFRGLAAQAWAFSQMQASRGPLAKTPEIGFHKMLGTGTGEGFTPYPNFSVYSILAVWPSLEIAEHQIARSPVYNNYRDHSVEDWTVYLGTTRVRGAWAGVAPFTLPGQNVSEPDGSDEKDPYLAVLTRASVKPRHVMKFWRHVPNIEDTIREQDRLLFKMGLGEIPWLHQVTFSIWDDAEAMKAFAYKGYHSAAVEAVRAEGWFTEELFARFRVLGTDGTWEGQDPLTLMAKTPDAEDLNSTLMRAS